MNIVVGDGVNEAGWITIAGSVCDSGDGTDCVEIFEMDGWHASKINGMMKIIQRLDFIPFLPTA
jgi:hypothetical protein